jgi:muramidase (phage lysozyme)
MTKQWIAALAGCVALAGGASVAVAQDFTASDGGPPNPGGQYQQTACGPELANVVRTQSAPGTTSSVPWVNLPGTPYAFNVADNASRCVKVLLTAETSCTGFAGNDYCYVQALIDGVPMDPDGANYQAMDSEDDTASAHAYEWIKRVGPGNHVLTIQQRVGNVNTVFRTDDWTEDIQIKG